MKIVSQYECLFFFCSYFEWEKKKGFCSDIFNLNFYRLLRFLLWSVLTFKKEILFIVTKITKFFINNVAVSHQTCGCLYFKFLTIKLIENWNANLPRVRPLQQTCKYFSDNRFARPGPASRTFSRLPATASSPATDRAWTWPSTWSTRRLTSCATTAETGWPVSGLILILSVI